MVAVRNRKSASPFGGPSPFGVTPGTPGLPPGGIVTGNPLAPSAPNYRGPITSTAAHQTPTSGAAVSSFLGKSQGLFGAPAPAAPAPAPAAAPANVNDWLAQQKGLLGASDNPFDAAKFNANGWDIKTAPPKPDVDVSQKGDLENAWTQHGAGLFQPGAASDWNRTYGGLYSQPTAAEDLWQQQGNQPLMNNALTEYQGFGARRPNIATEPGFGSYYDQAEKRLAQQMNRQLGARGMFGSTMGADQLGLSISDLRADQAKNEAQYNLDRLAEQRQWTELGGTLGRNADLSEREGLNTRTTMANNASTAKNDRLDGWRGAATDADKMDLARQSLGFAAASDSQLARERRAQQGFTNNMAMSGALNDLFGGAFGDLLNTSGGSLDSLIALLTGQATNDANYASQNRAGNEALISLILGGGLGR